MGLLSKIKKLRIVTILSNVKYFSALQHNSPLYKKYAIRRRVWQTLSHKSIQQHDADLPWLDQSDPEEMIKVHPAFQSFSENIQQQLLQWNECGYMILPEFFSQRQMDKVDASLKTGLTKKENKKYSTNRLINLFKKNEEINTVFRDPRLLQIVSFILGRKALPYQTINFLKSASQAAHSDSVHLTTEPAGYLAGVWVALEDVQAGTGEFFCYPGSHKLPYIYNEHFDHKNNFWNIDKDIHEKYEKRIAQLILDNGLKKKEYLPKKGDILIWHANLLHGSSPKVNTAATRKSLIMHYFAEGVLCYHELIEKPAILHN